jgi:hypothetical protein
VETNFDALVFQGCEEFVDAVGAAVGCLGVEEAEVCEALGDSLFSSEGLLALEASYVGKSRVDGLLDNLVCTNGRVVHFHACAHIDAGAIVERIVAKKCFERRVPGCRVSATTC